MNTLKYKHLKIQTSNEESNCAKKSVMDFKLSSKSLVFIYTPIQGNFPVFPGQDRTDSDSS